MSLSRIVKAEPLFKKVYKSLLLEIETGKLKAGTKVNESMLSEQLGVSRTPIREAFRLLISEGWIEENEGNYFIFRPSKEDFLLLYECRSELEGLAAKRMAIHATEEEIFILKDLLNQTREQLKIKNYESVLELNNKFHQHIIDSSYNTHLQRILAPLKNRIFLYRKVLNQLNRNDTFFPDHVKVYQAIEKRDGVTAEKEMVQHLQEDRNFLEKHYVD